MEKKSRKSASKWTQASERALIAIWRERVGDIRGCRKNSHIVAEMMAEMIVQGFSYTVGEIKTKMHNLTVRYRKEKQIVGVSGGSPSEWDLYQEMHVILGPYKSYNCENLVLDSINDIYSDIYNSSPSSSSCAAATLSTAPITENSTISSPMTSPDMSSSMEAPTSSKETKKNKKESLSNVLKKIETSIGDMKDEMQKTSQKMLEIEEGKKKLLEEYVNREAEVQKALVEFLKRP